MADGRPPEQELRETLTRMRDCGNRLVAERDEARSALDAVNTLRSCVIATQNAGWSNMIYPLVAILNAAGFPQFDPSDEQLAAYKDCYGGAGGYPGAALAASSETAE